MNHSRDCLKRSYPDGPGASIAHAQTTVEEARKQNLARQAEGAKRAQELYLKPETVSAWSNKAREAFEGNVFAPEADPLVVQECKDMKGGFLQEGRRLFPTNLLSALSDTAKFEIEIDGAMVDRSYPQFKLALPS